MTRIRTHTPQVNTSCWLHGYILPNHTTQGHVCGRQKLNVLCEASNCYWCHRPWRSVQLPNTCLCLGNHLHFLGDEPAWALFNLTRGPIFIDTHLPSLTYPHTAEHTANFGNTRWATHSTLWHFNPRYKRKSRCRGDRGELERFSLYRLWIKNQLTNSNDLNRWWKRITLRFWK